MCRCHASKGALFRVVRSSDGIVSLDLKGNKPGRGAYVCKSMSCVLQLIKGSRLDAALRCKVPKETIEELKEMIKKIHD